MTQLLPERVPSRRKILVVTGDRIADRIAGPGIRAWEIAGQLAREHDVVLGSLQDVAKTSPSFTARKLGAPDLRELEGWCDIIVFQGTLLTSFPWLVSSRKVIVVDIYDPFHLEILEQERDRPEQERNAALQGAIDIIRTQLLRADFVLCASAKQRDLWMGHLAAYGRVNHYNYDADPNLDRLLAVAPFGISATPPRHERAAVKGVLPGIGADDSVILWGGGIYNWFDPLTLIRAVDRITDRHPQVRLLFLGTKHPNPFVPEMRVATEARALAESLGLTGKHVFFGEDWVPFDDRQNYLLEADIGVSCHLSHVETEFSFRTRILDYLWAGLPIVTTDGDAFGDLVTAHDLGAAVAAEDVEQLAESLASLLDEPDRAERCRENVRALAQSFVWERALEPLVAFCRDPHRAPDLMLERFDAEQGLPVPPRTVRSELRLAVTYFREGGIREVVRRAAGRLSRDV